MTSQSAFAHSSGGAFSLVLGTTPTVGNLLVLVAVGYSPPPTPPPGFVTYISDNNTTATNQGVYVGYRIVQAGDGQTYTFSTSSNTTSAFLIDTAASGITATLMAGGAASSISTSALVADPTTSLRLLIAEWDNTSLYPTNTPVGGTLWSPTSWYGPIDSYYHGAAVWAIPDTTVGVQTITLSGPANNSVLLDLQIRNAALPPLITTQTVREVLHTNNAPLVSSQTTREVLHTNVAKLATAQTMREVLHTINPRFSYSQVFREVLHTGNVLLQLSQVVREVLHGQVNSPAPWLIDLT
jgi:hypothetical protein